MKTRTAAAAALLLAVVVVVTGCTSDDKPAPTGTAEPTRTQASTRPPQTTLTLSPKEQNIEDAKTAYKHYRGLYDEVAQGGYHDWDAKLRTLTVGDHRADLIGYARAAEAAGAHQVGTVKVVSMTATEYVDSGTGSGHERVTFEVCEDDTGRQVIMPDGTDDLIPGTTGRFVATTTMAHAGDAWIVANYHKDRGRPC
ncbi:MAG: hypothetical protein FWH11_09010 [Micrococcales bacterium]|nr:hypothetical protein [Micrococcales bacterium]